MALCPLRPLEDVPEVVEQHNPLRGHFPANSAGSHTKFTLQWLKFQMTLLSPSPWPVSCKILQEYFPLPLNNGRFFTQEICDKKGQVWDREFATELHYMEMHNIILPEVKWVTLISGKFFATSLGIYYNRIDHGKLICWSCGCNN